MRNISSENEILNILNHNNGFKFPKAWMSYARENDFKKVDSVVLGSCPDCGHSGRRKIGQQIYYSTLILFQQCQSCGLIYADTHLSEEVIVAHFESTYKDHEYFLTSRGAIFRQVSQLVDQCSPARAKVIDIGGAEGHLLSMIYKKRPDLDLTLSDISKNACEYAQHEFGLKTLCLPIKDLHNIDQKFDTLVLIDIIYYEPIISGLWKSIASLTNKNGTLIIRLPNKYPLIILHEKIQRRLIAGGNDMDMSVSIKFLNPEHVYIFTRAYLTQRLKKLGFKSVKYIPATPLGFKGIRGIMVTFYYFFAKLLFKLTFGRLIVTPSYFVVAKRSI